MRCVVRRDHGFVVWHDRSEGHASGEGAGPSLARHRAGPSVVVAEGGGMAKAQLSVA